MDERGGATKQVHYCLQLLAEENLPVTLVKV
jgi:hypothetical protein